MRGSAQPVSWVSALGEARGSVAYGATMTWATQRFMEILQFGLSL
jgi:hypothetical protein